MSGSHQILLAATDPPFNLTLSTATDVNVRTAALGAGWNGFARLIVTIPAGQIISASTTSIPACTVSGSFPAGVTLINNGTIVGRGGNGGAGGYSLSTAVNPPVQAAVEGSAGGVGLFVSSAVSVDNSGGAIYGGGGGGGGGGAGTRSGSSYSGQGGGGGGGAGVSSGGAGGPFIGGFTTAGANGIAGTISAAGGGGTGGTQFDGNSRGGNGGAGGALGTAGSTGTNGALTPNPGKVGGAAGAYISGNSNVTWISLGVVAGGVV